MPWIAYALALLLPLTAVAVDLTPGDVVVVDPGRSPARVIRVDPTTGAQSLVAEGGLLDRPFFAVPAPNGDLLVVDGRSDGTDGAVIRIDGVGGEQTVVSDDAGLVNPFGVALAPDGTIFVTDVGLNQDEAGDDRLLRIDPSTGSAGEVILMGGGVGALEGIAVAPDGRLLIADAGAVTDSIDGDERILRVDPATGSVEVFTAGDPLAAPRGLFQGPSTLFVADQAALSGFGAVLGYDGSGGLTLSATSRSFVAPQDVAVSGSRAFVTDPGAQAITGSERVWEVSLDAEGTPATELTSGDLFGFPLGITVVTDPTCGDGAPSPGEQCDDGAANGAVASCCAATCVRIPDDQNCDVENECTVGQSRCTNGVCEARGGCPIVRISELGPPVGPDGELIFEISLAEDTPGRGKIVVKIPKTGGRLDAPVDIGATLRTDATSAPLTAKACRIGKRVLRKKLRLLSGELSPGHVARLAARLNRRGKRCLEASNDGEIGILAEVEVRRRVDKPKKTLLDRFRASRKWRR